MVRFVGSSWSSSDGSRSERERLLRFNIEHCEMYWQRTFCETGESCVVLLVDCFDPVGRMLGDKLSGPDRCAASVAECRERGVIPTMHASIPLDNAVLILSALHPSFVETVRRCPADCFPIWVVAAGGSSLAYRERPPVPAELSH